MRTALVTIASGRHEHLRRQRDWVATQSEPPLVHVVVSMGDPGIHEVARARRDVPTDVVDCPVGEHLPLAAARNAGVSRAVALGADRVVLLDVDCLPHRDLVRDYARALDRLGDSRAVVSGRVQYLPEGMVEDDYTPKRVAQLGRDHAVRVLPPPGELERADPRLLWSLSMACSVATWNTAGGFDERYVGYGGEDTDFGQRLAASGGELWWLGGAAAYHQYHPTQSPPVQHAAAIARNANLFRHTWGFDPMEGWLRELAAMGHLARVDGEWRLAEQRSRNDA